MAYFEQINLIDGTTLVSANVTSNVVSSAIDTTNYASVTVSVTENPGSLGYFTMYLEGSNDQVEWFTLLVDPIDELAPTDSITRIGGYSLKTTFKFIRYNVTLLEAGAAINLVLVGRSGTGSSGADKLSAAFNPDTPLQVAFGQGVKQDRFGALMLSDGVPYYMQGNNTYMFNLNGYSTIVMQLGAVQTATCSQSIDGVFWSACYFGSTNATTTTNAPNNVGIWTGPVVGQYLRVVLSVAAAGPTQCSIILKQAPMNGSYWNTGAGSVNIAQSTATIPANITQLGGSAITSAGIAGTLAVGGYHAVNAAVTTNPTLIGGSDAANLTRRFISDTGGRQLITGAFAPTFGYNSNSPQANTTFPMYSVGVIPATYLQTGALNVQDTAQFEGQNQLELLSQILLELRIMNQQLYELPRLIATQQPATDAPETFRQDPSIFNQ